MGRNAKNVALYCSADRLDPRMVYNLPSHSFGFAKGLLLAEILKDVYVRNFYCQNSSQTSGSPTVTLAHRQA